MELPSMAWDGAQKNLIFEHFGNPEITPEQSDNGFPHNVAICSITQTLQCYTWSPEITGQNLSILWVKLVSFITLVR